MASDPDEARPKRQQACIQTNIQIISISNHINRAVSFSGTISAVDRLPKEIDRDIEQMLTPPVA